MPNQKFNRYLLGRNPDGSSDGIIERITPRFAGIIEDEPNEKARNSAKFLNMFSMPKVRGQSLRHGRNDKHRTVALQLPRLLPA